MTRRRVRQLEDRAGVGRTAWSALAGEGERAALEAVREKGGDADTVRQVFAVFRASYARGMSEGEREGAADRALDALRDRLPREAYALTLALLRYGLL